ncbi:MAG: hypothetical protein V3V24_09665 [Nitrospinaceae bacterium]
MAKGKDELFWMGAGVVQIGGKEYGADDPLPTDKIPKAQLDKWLESGKVRGMVKAGGVGVEAILSNAQARVAELEKQLADSDAAKVAALDKCAELEKESGEDKARIAELEKQIETLTAPMKDGDK